MYDRVRVIRKVEVKHKQMVGKDQPGEVYNWSGTTFAQDFALFISLLNWVMDILETLSSNHHTSSVYVLVTVIKPDTPYM